MKAEERAESIWRVEHPSPLEDGCCEIDVCAAMLDAVHVAVIAQIKEAEEAARLEEREACAEPRMSMFAIGDSRWAGGSKLIEECGETVQVCGKLMGTRGGTQHWEGRPLDERLEDELADLQAAITFVIQCNPLDGERIRGRTKEKLERFNHWHAAEDPPPQGGG